MNTRLSTILVGLLISSLLAACGPPQEQLAATATQAAASLKQQQDAAATQAAASIFATLTAQAPTITPTFTPSPTATATPTATPTPKPTSTATPTVTPTPSLESAALTLDDLPEGFVAMLPEQVEIMGKAYSEAAKAFGFQDFKNSQAVTGVLIPITTRADQATFDANLQKQADSEITGAGCGNRKKLDGLEELGEGRVGLSGLVENGYLTMRCDVIVFRRGEVGVILFVIYPDGDKLTRTSVDLAALLDKRIQSYLAGR